MTCLRPEVLGTEMVSLIVGPEAKQFYVHKKLLCDRCEYFSKAFNSDFREANCGIMTFPDDTEEAFTTFITWLYGGTILLPGTPTDQILSTSDFLEKHFLPAYILADKLCNHDLMNRLIDLLQDFQDNQRTYFDAIITQRVFEEISSQSKLQLYFAASFAFFLAKRDWNTRIRDGFVDKLCTKPEFVRALFTFRQENADVLSNPGREFWELEDRSSFEYCYYHTHREGEDCYLE